MKRIIIIAAILLSASALYAQQSNAFYKNEIKVSFGDAYVTSNLRLDNEIGYTNLSLAYLYRTNERIWLGANFVNYFGEKIHYNWREYAVDGSFKDFSKSKNKHFAIIAPEIRFSYLNKETVMLYGAFSGGVGVENGYDTQKQKYPNVIFPCVHLTYFGLSGNIGKKNNIILGGEYEIS